MRKTVFSISSQKRSIFVYLITLFTVISLNNKLHFYLGLIIALAGLLMSLFWSGAVLVVGKWMNLKEEEACA